LLEEVMGKERKLEGGEKVFVVVDSWPSVDPLHCKLKLRLQRGSSEDIQMSFRKVVYG